MTIVSLLIPIWLYAAEVSAPQHTAESLGLAITKFSGPLWALTMAYVGTSNIVQRGNIINIASVVKENSRFEKPMGITRIICSQAGDFITLHLLLWENSSITYTIQGEQDWTPYQSHFDNRKAVEFMTIIPQKSPTAFSYKTYASVCDHNSSTGGQQVRVLERKSCPTYSALMEALEIDKEKDLKYENDLQELLFASTATKESKEGNGAADLGDH